MTENKPPITVQDIDRAPSTLPAPTLPAAIQDELQKYKLAFVKVSEEKVCLLEENACLKRSVETSKILDGLLTPYANRSFIFMCCYCGVVAFLIVASGWKLGGFDLPSGVLQVLTGSTAVTVIGLVGMVLTGIFCGRPKALSRMRLAYSYSPPTWPTPFFLVTSGAMLIRAGVAEQFSAGWVGRARRK